MERDNHDPGRPGPPYPAGVTGGRDDRSGLLRGAGRRDMEVLQSIECPDNRGALKVERDPGFEISFYPDDPRLDLVSKRLDGK
jgi:hypothetical protein